MAVVGAPSHFAQRSQPKPPQKLIGHNCINLRLPTHGGLYAWEFEKDGLERKVRVGGQLVFNGTAQCSTRRWPDSAWLMCRATAVSPLSFRPSKAAEPAYAPVRGSRRTGSPPDPGVRCQRSCGQDRPRRFQSAGQRRLDRSHVRAGIERLAGKEYRPAIPLSQG